MMKTDNIAIDYLNVLCLVSDTLDRKAYHTSNSNAQLKCFTTFHYLEDLETLQSVNYQNYDIIILEASLVHKEWIDHFKSSVRIPIIFLLEQHAADSVSSLILEVRSNYLVVKSK